MGIDLGPILYMVLAVEVVFGLLCVAGGFLLVRKWLAWTKEEETLTADEASQRSEKKARFAHSWALVKR
jgi:hypothetical protein